MPVIKSSSKTLISFLTNLGHLWIDKSILRAIQLTIILIVIQAGLIFFSFPRLPPQVPLYYSQPWGESQLTPPQSLFVLPSISLLFMLTNIFLATFFFEKKKFSSICLVWGSTIVALFSTITLVKIIILAT